MGELILTRHTTRINRMALVLVTLSVLAVLLMPFVVVKPNRIAAGEAKTLLALLQQPTVLLFMFTWLSWIVISLKAQKTLWRLIAASLALFTLVLALGNTASALASTPAIRITPASAFWSLLAIFSLSLTDALIRFQLLPWQRLIALAAYLLLGTLLFTTGVFDNLAIMKEYDARSAQFWAEGKRHLQLTFGSLLIALAIGLPLGVVAFQQPKLRTGVLHTLSLIQTIPSLALFGLLMAPLAWLATHVNWMAALGIRGIGVAPALIALVMYSLLPIVANTVVGLNNVSPSVREAAKGMGMTRQQRLWQVEMPLAFPVILTGIRIVLVQAIGLVTVAALVGGGGFGTFVFQGLGQTSTDLVLLGALPTVFLAFVAAVVLDALVDTFKKL